MNYDPAAVAACDVDGNLPDDPCLKVLSPADRAEALHSAAAIPMRSDTAIAFLRAALCTRYGQSIHRRNQLARVYWCTSTSGGGPQTRSLFRLAKFSTRKTVPI